ncbi:hypothetical protein B0H66DRAFT_595883 [Apodospora peruviana]|uniref:Uncharacterized protein n=1 Tax=Apodospora peruviana TaxID=516989 RepID=A0AAE0HSW6_9PEZI|nr:hypothetical protein B0H66DRAFT_595883 [Apodospora peruviana]
MAELLAISASAIALVQAVELACNTVRSISDIKSAPAEARRVGEELQQVRAIVQQVERHVIQNAPVAGSGASASETAAMLHSRILALKEDLDGFQRLVGPYLLQGTTLARLKLRTKWLMGLDKRLAQISERLSTHGGYLQLAFSLYTSHEARSSSIQVRRRLDTLLQAHQGRHGGALFQTGILDAAPAGLLPTAPLTSAVLYGSPKTCAKLLNDAASIIHGLTTDNDGLLCHTSNRMYDWVLSHLYGILHDIFSGQVVQEDGSEWSAEPRAPLLLQRQDNLEGSPMAAAKPPQADSVFARQRRAFLCSPLQAVSSITDSKEVEFYRKALRQHQLDIHLHRLSNQNPASSPPLRGTVSNPWLRQCRLYVAPRSIGTSRIAANGSIVYISELSGGPTSRYHLSKTLATFGVCPNSSPVFEHIKSGNTAAVQRMLSLGLVSPNDRDEEGNSLLWHCLWNPNTRYAICELLLQQNADPSDCNRRGDHALAVLVMDVLPRLRVDGDVTVVDILALIDLLLQFCGANISEACGTLCYKSRKGVQVATAGLLHCAIPRQRQESNSEFVVSQLPVVFSRLVRGVRESNMDLELIDKNGNTALLYTLFYHPGPVVTMVETSTFLIDAGADVRVTNKHSEGGLHLLCRRLSACSRQNLPKEEKEGITNLLAQLMTQGLDPVARNNVGYTPIDAAMSPAVWPLLCSALKQIGRDMREELRLLDLASGVTTLSEAEYEAKFCEAVRLKGTTSSLRIPSDPLASRGSAAVETSDGGQDRRGICYICGQGPDEFFRDAPFDEFYTGVVVELGEGIHMVEHKHYDWAECLAVHEEDSCHTLDYHPAEMAIDRLKERSWRRHVAVIFEERGLLS